MYWYFLIEGTILAALFYVTARLYRTARRR